jgi:hypothetical protein
VYWKGSGWQGHPWTPSRPRSSAPSGFAARSGQGAAGGYPPAHYRTAGPAQLAALERTVELLLAYGEAKFGDEWWPGNASNWLTDGRGAELEQLLDPGAARAAEVTS